MKRGMKETTYGYDDIVKLYDDEEYRNLPFSGRRHRDLNKAFFDARYVYDPVNHQILHPTNPKFGGKKEYPLNAVPEDTYKPNAGAIQLFDIRNNQGISPAIKGMSGWQENAKGIYAHTERHMIRKLLERLMNGQKQDELLPPSQIARDKDPRNYQDIAHQLEGKNARDYKDYLARYDPVNPGSGNNIVKMWSERKRCENCEPFTNKITPDNSEVGYLSDHPEAVKSVIQNRSRVLAEAYARKNYPKYQPKYITRQASQPPQQVQNAAPFRARNTGNFLSPGFLLSDDILDLSSSSSSEDFPAYTPEDLTGPILPSPGPAELGFGYGLPNIPLHLQIGNVFDAYAPQRDRAVSASPASDPMRIDSRSPSPIREKRSRSRSRSPSSSSTSPL